MMEDNCGENILKNAIKLSWKKKLKCASCSILFSIHTNFRRPMVLQCGHIMCEKCIDQKFRHGISRQPVKIMCKICSHHSTYRSDAPFKDQLEINLHLFGHMVFQTRVYPNWAQFTKKLSTVKDVYDASIPDEKCYECNVKNTHNKCVQCNVPFCQSCFDATHSLGKTIQLHSLVPLWSDQCRMMDSGHCVEHNELVEFYCKDCRLTTCFRCNGGEHRQHTVVKIYDENVKSKAELKESIGMLIDAKKMTEKGSKEIEKMISNLQDYAADTVSEIHQEFAYMHGLLQLSENKVLEQVKLHLQHFINEGYAIESQLADSRKKFDEKIACLNHFSKNVPKFKRLTNLIEETTTFLENVPCEANIKHEDGNPFHYVSRADGLKTHLDSLHQLTATVDWISVDYRMYLDDREPSLSENTTPDATKVARERAKQNSKKQSKVARPKAKAPTNLSPPEVRAVPIGGAVKKLYRNRQPPALSVIMLANKSVADLNTTPEGSMTKLSVTRLSDNPASTLISNKSVADETLLAQNVKVSHIINPHSFFVQNQTFLNCDSKYATHCYEAAQISTGVEHPITDELYLTYSKVSQQWYRAKVVREVATARGQGKMFTVQYLDFGSTEDVHVSHFRLINDELRDLPKGAIACSLYGVEPKGCEWPGEATALMAEIVANGSIKMVIIKEGDPHEIDLISLAFEYPVSVRDLILYEGLADPVADSNGSSAKRFARLGEYKESMFKKAAATFYPPTVTNKSYISVKVVNANSPSEFYVIQTDHIRLFDKLKADMNQAYANTTNKIFVPRESMLCAVKAVDNKWYRGLIVAVLPKHKVQVHLVDMGHKINVATKNTRYLTQDFKIQSKAAMLCMLADVRPLRVHNYDWPKEAIDYFKSRTEMANKLQMAVIKTGKEGVFSVVLSVVQPTEEICINGLLVRKGWCESVGQESTVVSIPNYDCYETKEAGGDLDVTTVSLSKRGVEAAPAATSDRNSKKKKMRMLVRLVNIVSPGDFQAILKKHEPALQEMDRNIQLAMGDELKTDFLTVEWQPHDYCLVFWREDGARDSKWWRGKIVERDGDEKYKVYLRDTGSTITTANTHLARCPDEFAEPSDGVIACHMAFVGTTLPAANQWSKSSVDELLQVVEMFEEIGLSLHTKVEATSFPVVVWGMTSTYGDAFAPCVPKWCNINQLLVDQGLANQLSPLLNEVEQSGYVDLEEQIFKSGDHFDQYLQKVIAVTQPDCDDSHQPIPIESFLIHSLTTEVMHISSWPPAIPINKRSFHGRPTFVDNNGVIYLHDALQGPLLDSLRLTINEAPLDTDEFDVTIMSLQPKREPHYRKGQPCLARFHVDELFYRASILKMKNETTYSVQFIDYGNIEIVHVRDLRANVIAGNIPIQATKYRLANVSPAAMSDKSLKWPIPTLDALHTTIVSRDCLVRVVGDQATSTTPVVPCLLKVLDIDADVSALLVEKKMLVYDKNFVFNESVDITWDPYADLAPTPDFAQPTALPDTMDDLIDVFHRKEEQRIRKYLQDYEPAAQPDFAGIYYWQRQNAMWQQVADVPECETSVIDFPGDDDGPLNLFDPLATSSVVGSTLTTTVLCERAQPIRSLYQSDLFPHYVLHPDQESFWGEVVYTENTCTYYVFAYEKEHLRQQKSMQQALQVLGQKRSVSVDFLRRNAVCVARNGDGKWQRAVVQTVDGLREEVTALFVDTLVLATVKATDTRQMPAAYQKIPLRNFVARLWGVRISPRVRQIDIQRRMIDLVQGRRCYIVVRSYDPDRPECEFYTDETGLSRVYDELFDQRWFLVK